MVHAKTKISTVFLALSFFMVQGIADVQAEDAAPSAGSGKIKLSSTPGTARKAPDLSDIPQVMAIHGDGPVTREQDPPVDPPSKSEKLPEKPQPDEQKAEQKAEDPQTGTRLQAPALPELEIEEIQTFDKGRPTQPVTPVSTEPLEAKAVVVDIISDNLKYDTNKNLYTATGAVHVVVSEQNTELVADKVVYDPAQELMIAEGSVVINNRGDKTYGTYAKIDLNRKSALINDPVTQLDEVRVKARQAFVAPEYVQLENGKLVIPPQKRVQQSTYHFNEITDGDISRLAVANPLLAEERYENKTMTQEMDMDWDQPLKGWRQNFKLHAREVEIRRNEDGYDDINLIHPRYKWGNLTLAALPQMDFAHDTENEDVEYLGPDIGIDPDLGGFYFGPGWDFRLGKGFLKFSPIASYGVGSRRSRGGQALEETSGFGLGGVLNYLSHKTKITAAYNHKVGTPTLYARRKIGGGKTQVMVAANDDYTQGFLGWERPKYIAQLTDYRKLYEGHNVRVHSFGSIGAAHDEFFPTNDEDFFVKPKDEDATPVTAGRVQLQAEIRNMKPLLTIGNAERGVDFGFAGQLAMAGYTTGDFVGVMRAGPSVYFRMGTRFSSYNRYFYAQTAGETPFVFDTYYRGRNSLESVNQYRVNKFVTVGLNTSMSLSKDNDQSALFTNNSVFMLLGPEDIKLNLAYDFIRQRSFFGINYIPGSGRKTVYYDRLKMYQPIDFGAAIPPANAANPLTGVEDIGMMNGNKAR